MKFFMITASLIALATGANALTIDDRSTAKITAVAGDLSFGVSANQDGLSSVSGEWITTRGSLSVFDTYTSVSLEYSQPADSAILGVEAGASYAISPVLSAYTIANVDYVADVDTLDKGNVFLTPVIGLSASITDNASVYGEVGYAYNVSNSFQKVDGYGEIGLEIGVAEGTSVVGSVRQTFDTASDQTTGSVELVLSF